ncbi:Uncharacterized conserved protein YbbC, DUF1343 family [Chitinophaga terrae (ex Kim and Jung 2007)]|uniref:Uncharacterized conserved protein YbbC, DUF1343 family n=2 Tax=Chitinophaga terrae (ex Kim and Jung 2007) TaxID=408074 RepID=A0A1H4BZT3_9BACT|nr:hypothetical protein CTE07_35870 [Chitinophaga terrae (ex Kim and Jung 2007)]SEA53594.1 Uncharacterized conserved protein YbbC, DUF1343 family [Chitinophaga terrae (ex Kim and Jung 2007)]
MVNQTSTIDKTHLVDSLLKLKINIVKIFSPEHGFRGTAGHGESVANSIDSATGLPIISLYGQHRKATAADLKDVDILVFDVQDVGTRFFTYISSLQELMESAAENKKTLVILDRPNPNGDYIDGPVLDTAYRSFVGMQPIPVVHGMTVAEYARMLNGERWLSKGLKCDIKVVPCENYTHQTYYKLPVKPSPNLPNMAAVNLYPSLCFFEGTALSLGRGTDKPFQVYGSPLFPKQDFSFTPKASATNPTPVLKDQVCYGFDLSHAPETVPYKGRKLELKWLISAYHLFPNKDKFFNPFFAKLAGTKTLQQQIEKGLSEAEIRKSWEPGLAKFKVIRAKYLLY